MEKQDQLILRSGTSLYKGTPGQISAWRPLECQWISSLCISDNTWYILWFVVNMRLLISCNTCRIQYCIILIMHRFWVSTDPMHYRNINCIPIPAESMRQILHCGEPWRKLLSVILYDLIRSSKLICNEHGLQRNQWLRLKFFSIVISIAGVYVGAGDVIRTVKWRVYSRRDVHRHGSWEVESTASSSWGLYTFDW